MTDLWMPWLGKSFRPAEGSGINVMRRDARLPIVVMWPSIRPGAVDESRLEAFPFRLRRAPGELEPSVDVLKIDYDFDANPRFVIRRILDEVVEVEDGLYLGRVLYRWRGRFHRIGFFTLERPAEGDLGTIEERASRSGGIR